jgi:hypothetical protein
MIRRFLVAVLFTGITGIALGQPLDSLKLDDKEVPDGYSKSDELLCVTPHAYSFYTQTDLYETFLGKLTKKEFQSFGKKGDKGSILYFEFEKEFKGQDFLNGLLWGGGTKPSMSEPDEYYSKGNILIVWSFNLKSELKEISRTKVMKHLQ